MQPLYACSQGTTVMVLSPLRTESDFNGWGFAVTAVALYGVPAASWKKGADAEVLDAAFVQHVSSGPSPELSPHHNRIHSDGPDGPVFYGRHCKACLEGFGYCDRSLLTPSERQTITPKAGTIRREDR